MGKKAFFCLILIVVSILTFSQNTSSPPTNDNFFSLNFTPGLSVPLLLSSELFELGGGADLHGSFMIFPSLYIDAGIGYSFNPVKNNPDIFIHLFSPGVGVRLNLEVNPNFNIGLYGKAGYFFGFLTDPEKTDGSNPFASSGIYALYRILDFLSLGIDVSYRHFFGMHSDIDISFGCSYHIITGKGRALIKKEKQEIKPDPLLKDKKEETEIKTVPDFGISRIEFKEIFPILFKYYDDHSLGNMTLINNEKVPIENITVKLFVKQYMDGAKVCAKIDRLEPGTSQNVELYALFNNSVLSITEGTKVLCKIIIEYKQRNKELEKEITESIIFQNRNAVTWDDDRKAAAFVTSKDSTILKFSKNVVGMIKGKASKALNNNLLMAIGIHETLALYGMTYVEDPSTPYKEFSKEKLTLDFLQFPNQTLEYRAGDCDDLSILYCALLEAIGIKTAFITVPGHIFIAFSLDMKPNMARKTFIRPDDLIFIEDNSWLPLEITQIGDGFLKAWQIGAKEWREYSSKEQAGFIPVHDAWEVYAPVGFDFPSQIISLPSEEKIVDAYTKEVKTFINREIYEKVANLKADIKKSQGDPKHINKLGVLYAKYGFYEEAVIQFEKIAEKKKYVPALVNLGNIYYIKKNYDKALSYYNKAYDIAPNNKLVLLYIARINHDLENYGSTAKAYKKLKQLDYDLALQFAYLDLKGSEADRAAEISQVKDIIIWNE